jgi:hypothetical protein
VILALVLLLPSAPAHADSDLAALQQLDGRVQSVGWRLARGNAAFCKRKAPAIGLQLHDVYNYRDPAAVRRALGLASDIAVEAVAAGGPAANAGLAANDSLSEIAGERGLPAVKPGDYARLARLNDRMDAVLALTGQVALTVLRRSGPAHLTIVGEEACTTRFEMLTEGNRASADGQRVVVSRKLVSFLPEDELLAGLLAHELAHNVLDHRVRLNAAGRSWSNVRATEREADRLSVWLLANAGYDPAAALRFMARWGPPNDNGIFSTPDHDRWRTRLRTIQAELTRLDEARAADPRGEANWPRDFVPQQRLEAARP